MIRLSDVTVFFDSTCGNCDNNESATGKDIIELPLSNIVESGLPICSECGEDLTIIDKVNVNSKSCPLYVNYEKSCMALKNHNNELNKKD